MPAKKGFTLIELLVVLAIVAILSVAVILTLNPAELLKQARDSTRISDLGTLKSAISLYLADVTTPYLTAGTGTTETWTKCWMSNTTAATSTANQCSGSFTAFYTANGTSTSATNNRKVDGNGWVPMNFTSISSGAPIGNLPVDPLNTGTNFYAYGATSTNYGFKFATVLESSKYSGNMTTDGGGFSTYYEVGTALGL